MIFVNVTYFPRNMRVFRFIDRISQNACDAVWYQTERMRRVKAEEGWIKNKEIPRLLLPIGVAVDSESQSNPLERRTVGYVGRLDKDMGLDLVIEAFLQVTERVPDARFVIVGSGPSEGKLKQKVRMLGLEGNVEFKGFIGDRELVERMLTKWAVGVAPYVPEPGDPTYYADSAKAKEYIQAGIPIIITKVPEVALEIEQEKAGFAVEYDKDEVADAIIRLLTDAELWRDCQENTTRLALKYNYRELYESAFLKSGINL